MHWINWLIVVVYLVVVVFDGLRRTSGTKDIEGYFLANRSLPWWAVGLSEEGRLINAIPFPEPARISTEFTACMPPSERSATPG